jgi:CRISPR/Cas system CSM-associated protein Csm3 (group 7 of RAMP superfamily)
MIADAYLANEAEARVVVRDGVGIDRRSGAAAHNVKFQYEAITAGQFKTTLTLVNYELWQLGLVAHLLADLDSGTLTVGYGARRGLGRVRVGVQSVRLQWYGRHNPETAGYVIPRLSTLANTSAKAAQYQVQESTLVSVGLAEMAWKKVPATLGSAWNIIPSTSQEGVDWAAAPWPQFAATLPSVVTNWPA